MKRTLPNPGEIPELRSAILAQYDRSARDLPWRRDSDPYRVLVSEVMLQQTRVETVLKYYGPWLERFPTLEALADATEDEVMKAWEGLGYYRRARNLHQAARLIRERTDGGVVASSGEGLEGRGSVEGGSVGGGSEDGDPPVTIPSTREELRELPGVGEYTAGAVASIAFGEAVAAVDGNVRRVLARLFDEPRPKAAWLRKRARELLDPERPGDWNQALMELGATVCTPRGPACPTCPIAAWCGAHAAGTQDRRPAPSAKSEVPRARFALAVLERDGRLLVERRPDGGMLAGLWAFPEERCAVEGRREAGATEPSYGARAPGGAGGSGGRSTSGVAEKVARELGLTVVDGPRRLDEVRHRFTHLDATYLPEVAAVVGDLSADRHPARRDGDGADPTAATRTLRWLDPWHDDATALPVAQRKVLEAWCASTGGEVR